MAPSTPQHGRWLSRRYEYEPEDPEWTQFHKENKAVVPLLHGTVEELRQMMAAAKMRGQGKVEPIQKGLTVEDHTISSNDCVAITVRMYTPDSDPTAAMLYFHGGGWALGDLDGEDITLRALCVATGLVLASVDYRLAPENPYPAALNDGLEALEWMTRNAAKLRIDPSKILVGGQSAGANLAAVLSRTAEERGIPIRGQLLRAPVLCASDSHYENIGLKSMNELHDAAIITPRSIRQFVDWYKPLDAADATVSPLLASEMTVLPPTYLQVCGRDPLRDESLAYADRLEESGVAVRVNVYPGQPHVFWIFPEISASQTAWRDLLEGVKWLAAKI